MARYLYRCDTCLREEDVELAMATPKLPRPCPGDGCPGELRRVFSPSAHSWRDIQGREVRPPSKPWNWEDGRAVELAEFKQRNPTAGAVGSNPRG